MAANAPWSVKGIDPKAREIAKDLARRSGMTLGEWLNQMILEENPGTEAAPASEGARASLQPRIQPPEHPGDDVQRLTAALDRLTGLIATAAETRGGSASEAGLEQLAVSLAARVDAVRAEMAEMIREASDARFEGIERTLAEVTVQADRAERRAAGAIERMGREVLRMGDALGRRVHEVEQRSADAIEQIGAQVARMADGVDQRLARRDQANAEAMEKLGGEIGRISERLSERIATAERRSAEGLDDIGGQVAELSRDLRDRHARATSELSERIRLSEERTARLLDEARGRLDRRLEQTRTNLNPAVPPTSGEFAPAQREDAPAGASSYAAEGFAPADNAAAFRVVALEEFDEDEALIASPLAERDVEVQAEVEGLGAAEPPLGAAVGFEPRLEGSTAVTEPATDPELEAAPAAAVEPEPDGLAALDDASPEPAGFDDEPADEPGPAEAEPFAIHQQDAAAASFSDDATLDEEMQTTHALAVPGDEDAETTDFEPIEAQPARSALSTRELIEQTRAAARSANAAQAERRAPQKHRPGGAGKRRSAMTTALLVSGGAAALSMALVGYEFVLQQPAGQRPNGFAEALGFAAPAKPLTGERPAAGEGGSQPMAALALNPTPIAVPGLSAAQTEAAAESFAEGVRRIQAHDNSGLEALRHAANLGYGPAEFYLAKLYESGGGGVKKDLAEARSWTERAAEAGDVKAMHNLALDYFEGAGGPKDVAKAADWFHRAADQGLVDSQYNLARLYEDGLGVTRNPAEAYKWYLIAARSGDADSGKAAARLKNSLSPEAQSAAERSARSFATGAAAQAGATSASASAIATAQRGLSRLGYYQGPYDGVTSPALSLAIAAFERDQGLPATGSLDATVNQRLAAAAQ